MDATSASKREMRDQVLALLLSGQKSSRPHHVSPTTRRPSLEPWTPGAHLTFPADENEQPDLRLSPVSPESALPLDADVRLAELTAGLVAASDKERRQTDTIRRLALQLERSENHIRQLKNGGRDERRKSSRRSRKINPDDMFIELEELRRERKEWMKKERSAKKEARAASNLLSDIRRSAERVLSERDNYLRAIATLQQRLYEVEHPEISTIPKPPSPPPPQPPRSTLRSNVTPPPRPAFSQTAQSTPEGDTNGGVLSVQSAHSMACQTQVSPQSERTPREPPYVLRSRTGSLPDMSRTKEESKGKSDTGTAEEEVKEKDEALQQDDTGGANSETRGELFRDLNELLAENEGLKAKLFACGKEQNEEQERNEEQLLQLDVELGVLETFVEMMEFSLESSEIKELQHTISSIGVENKGNRVVAGDKELNVKSLTARVADVHGKIATKYGKFLNDYCTTSTDESVSMPTGVVLPPLPDTDVSLSRTVLPSVAAPTVLPIAGEESTVNEDDAGELE